MKQPLNEPIWQVPRNNIALYEVLVTWWAWLANIELLISWALFWANLNLFIILSIDDDLFFSSFISSFLTAASAFAFYRFSHAVILASFLLTLEMFFAVSVTSQVDVRVSTALFLQSSTISELFPVFQALCFFDHLVMVTLSSTCTSLTSDSEEWMLSSSMIGRAEGVERERKKAFLREMSRCRSLHGKWATRAGSLQTWRKEGGHAWGAICMGEANRPAGLGVSWVREIGNWPGPFGALGLTWALNWVPN